MSAEELPDVAPALPDVIAGWHVTGGYAQPAVAGGGYADMSCDGHLDVGYQTDQSARDMGLPLYLLTRIPVEVVRSLLATHDSATATALTPTIKAARLEQLRQSANHVAVGLAFVTEEDAAALTELAPCIEDMAKAARELVR